MQATVLSAALLCSLHATPLHFEPEDLRPGLIAEYRSRVDARAALARVDTKPAFTLGFSSPDARLPAGPFEVTWTGVFLMREPGPVVFEAFVSGEINLQIDGVSVLKGEGRALTAKVQGKQALERPAGYYRLKLRFRSLPDVPARVQIWWRGPTFSLEAIPAWRFGHVGVDVPARVRDEEHVSEGKKLAGWFGCARCHGRAFPTVDESPPGPALVQGRFSRDWLLRWLEDPSRVHADARMPALFAADEAGFAERWILADYLAKQAPAYRPRKAGDHRAGERAFLSVGCVACHFIPHLPRAEQADLDRIPLRGLGDRMNTQSLASFLINPQVRYPDGRMPRLPLKSTEASTLAAYLLLWSPPAKVKLETEAPPKAAREAVQKWLNASDGSAAAVALLREKGCTRCHPGLGPVETAHVPVRTWGEHAGCLSSKTLPRFVLTEKNCLDLVAFGKSGPLIRHASPFADRQRHLERSGCVRCHQRDTDRPAPLELASSKLGGSNLETVPFQRTPRLTHAHQKFTRPYLIDAITKGVSGLRHKSYSFRMPVFGAEAETLVEALAEADGDLPANPEAPAPGPTDPTAGSLFGPRLIGFQGYACVSCHLWDGQRLSEADPGAAGTDLTRVGGRIRHDWFDRFLEDPARFHPGTPMPGIFPKGRPAQLTSILDGDAARQREALGQYLILGRAAPSPKPPPPLAVDIPADSPLVAQIPMHLPDRGIVESITILNSEHDLLIYDLASASVRSVFVGGRVLRHVEGRLRRFSVDGTAVSIPKDATPGWQLHGSPKAEPPLDRSFQGYDLLEDGVRLRWQVRFASGTFAASESLRIVGTGKQRRLTQQLEIAGVPAGRQVVLQSLGQIRQGPKGTAVTFDLPPAQPAVISKSVFLGDPGQKEGSLERPGYRARAYPRPKTSSGEDLIMPGAVAVHPHDGRVFVASMKMGEIFVLRDPESKNARFENYARGLFQEAYSLLAEDDALYVLHRRNLSRLSAHSISANVERCDRVAAVPHGVADTYDYGYGLVRDRSGAFVYGLAPYANRNLPGSGGALRQKPGQAQEELAFGFRNPLGWCVGPEGEIFVTDNQGEWVASNKLVHLVQGRYYGFPNTAQKQHVNKPFGKAALWVPYGWARSINGVAYDNTGGKFGPFTGQFFLAELMFGGAIIRANLEKGQRRIPGRLFPVLGQRAARAVDAGFRSGPRPPLCRQHYGAWLDGPA
jgi:mono/diheme cytochrome c family protein